MAPSVHSSSSSLQQSPTNTNIPPNSGSSATSHQHQNAVNGPSNGNARVHPPVHERSRNARAQARHRAKRKAYIEQLEETVARLQAALSPYPPFNTTSSSSGVNGNPNASSNDQTQHQSSFGVSLSSPGSIPNSSGNSLSGFGPPSTSGPGQGSEGIDGSITHARLRALDLECNALRTYAETLRGMLTQHAPTVQIPPMPLPSSLPPSTMANAACSGLPSLQSKTNSNLNPNIGAGTLPPLNSTFPSFSSTTSTASASAVASASLSPGTYKIEPSGRVVGVKRPRRDSHSRSLSGSRSEEEEAFGIDVGDGENVGYLTPNATPPLNTKSNIASMPIHTSFPNSGIPSFSNPNISGRAVVPPPLTLPPVTQSQPSTAHSNSAHSTTHPTPPPPYNYSSNQSQQQQLASPHHSVASHQNQQQDQIHQQPQTNSHTHMHAQPQMTPMPPPVPWTSVSSVPSHANNAHPHGLQLPPPIPRFPGSSMPNLTRSFTYSVSASPNASGSRQDGVDSVTNVERGRVGSLSGGSGLGNMGGGLPLKREEESEPGLSAVYGSVGTENTYPHAQTQRHAHGRSQQHESFHSISPTSATAPSPAVAYASAPHQQQHHTQIPSPHTAHHSSYHHQQAPTMQRPLPSPASHQHQQATQSHYHHPQNQPAHQLHAPQHHQTQHQQNAAALPSPHSPYSPVGPNIPGSYRGYPEERYHHPSGQQHAHGHQQNQNQNQNYLWSPSQAGAVYGTR